MSTEVDVVDALTTDTSSSGPVSDAELDSIIDSAVEDRSTPETTVEEAAPRTPETAEDKPAETVAPEKPQPSAADERFVEASIPEGFKKAFQSLQKLDPGAAKLLKQGHYELHQYKEVLPLEEARQLRSMFPSVAEAQSAQKASADLMALNHTLATDPVKLMDFLEANSPEAFSRIATEFPRTMFDKDPGAYKETFAKPITNQFLGSLDAIADESGNQYLKEAVKVVREAAASWERNNTVPSNPWADRLAQYEQRDAQNYQDGLRSFIGDVDRTFVDGLNEATKKAFERSGATGLSSAAKKMVLDRVVGELHQQLRTDPNVRNQVLFASRGGNWDAGHRSKIVENLLQRAMPLMGPKLRDAIAWITDDVVAAAKGRIEKETRIASQAGTAPRGVSVGTDKSSVEWAKLSREQKAKFSDDDIFNAAASGRLG